MSTIQPIQAALQRAKNFKGIHNSDWTPFIAKLGDIVAETPLPEIEMCLVPVGSFMMGSDEGYADEQPAHQQNITEPYWIARYPVTNAQWRKAVLDNVVLQPQPIKAYNWYRGSQTINVPVVGITWFECLKFAEWAKCSLTSELLWEYAARGIENWLYTWGNDWDGDNYCIYGKNSRGKANPVGSKARGASWVDAMDMTGNVWEWQLSEVKPYPYIADDGRENNLDKTDIPRVLRGGSWNDSLPDYFRCIYRSKSLADKRSDYDGLRICFVP